MPKPATAKAALAPVPIELIEHRIYLVRSQKIMLDTDLAELYEVPTFRLNEAVKRNLRRFPEDFMFQLTKVEFESLKSQIAMSNGRGGRRTLPYAFTEHGVAMLSSVLHSERAVDVNILIVRAFIKMREMIAGNRELAVRVEKLEASQEQHASVINILADEINDIRNPPPPLKRRIGFQVQSDPGNSLPLGNAGKGTRGVAQRRLGR